MRLFVNDLTVMDFSYLCPDRGIVGESWIVDIELAGGLNDESMIQDFGIVKKQLKALIDNYVDHKLVVPADYSHTRITHDEQDDDVLVQFSYGGRTVAEQIILKCPSEAYAFVYTDSINKASVVQYLKDVIKTKLPENVQDIHIHLREEVIESAFYHYTHGLKKHDGNCQRIAHGHRSKIIISEAGQRDTKREKAWADKWQDIYIGSKEDLVDLQKCRLAKTAMRANINVSDYWAFEYAATQGEYSLLIPRAICDLIEYDSTVECIAQHIHEHIKQSTAAAIEVRAFEGVGKGAIVSDLS